MKVCHQVVRNAVQPGSEWYPFVLKVFHMPQRPNKNSCRQIFGIVMVPGAVIDIVVNSVNVPLVELAERFGMRIRDFNQFNISEILQVHQEGSRIIAMLIKVTPNRFNRFPIFWGTFFPHRKEFVSSIARLFERNAIMPLPL